MRRSYSSGGTTNEMCRSLVATEPSFIWVQNFADAYQAAVSRGVELVVPRKVWEAEFPGGGPSITNVGII